MSSQSFAIMYGTQAYGQMTGRNPLSSPYLIKELCHIYRTISPISHVEKVILKIILNRLKTAAEDTNADKQAEFRITRTPYLHRFHEGI